MNILVEKDSRQIVATDADFDVQPDKVVVNTAKNSYQLQDYDSSTVEEIVTSNFPDDLRPRGYFYTLSAGYVRNDDWSGWKKIEELIDNKQEEITQYRREYVDGGVVYAGRPFQTGPISRDNIIGTLTTVTSMMVAGNEPPNIMWIDENNEIAAFTPEQFIAFGTSVKQFITQVYMVARWHKDQVATLNERERILAYSFEATDFQGGGDNGWPVRDLGGSLT
jgi:hypothetical protein